MIKELIVILRNVCIVHILSADFSISFSFLFLRNIASYEQSVILASVSDVLFCVLNIRIMRVAVNSTLYAKNFFYLNTLNILHIEKRSEWEYAFQIKRLCYDTLGSFWCFWK